MELLIKFLGKAAKVCNVVHRVFAHILVILCVGMAIHFVVTASPEAKPSLVYGPAGILLIIAYLQGEVCYLRNKFGWW